MKLTSALILLVLIFPVALLAQPLPAPHELTLQWAVEYALEHSPDVKTAVAETNKRQGNVTTARSALLPELDVAGDFDRSRFEHGYPGGTPPSLLRFAQTTYSASADLHMLAWDFQKTSLELAAARQRLAASRVLTDRQKQEVIFEVARLYLQALTYQDLLRADGLTRKSLASLLDRTNELVKAGRAVPVDAFKIQTQIAQIDSDSATLEAGRQAALSSLAAAMGYDGQLPDLVYSPATEVMPATSGGEQPLVKAAFGQRLDLKAAMLETKSAVDLERAARRSYWPRIDFRATAIEYGAQNPVGFPTLIGRILPGMSVPNLATSGGVADWTVGVHIAVAELQSAQARVKAMREAVAQSQEILKNEQTKYEVGRTVINFVLEAEAGVLNSQSLLFQAQRSEAIASLALELGTGRLSPDSQGLK